MPSHASVRRRTAGEQDGRGARTCLVRQRDLDVRQHSANTRDARDPAWRGSGTAMLNSRPTRSIASFSVLANCVWSGARPRRARAFGQLFADGIGEAAGAGQGAGIGFRPVALQQRGHAMTSGGAQVVGAGWPAARGARWWGRGGRGMDAPSRNATWRATLRNVQRIDICPRLVGRRRRRRGISSTTFDAARARP